MSEVQKGNKVKVHYRGYLQDGTLFDSSYDSDPLEFTVGNNEVIPGFENAVVGMAVGETKRVTIAPQDAYGEYNEMAKIEVPRDQIPQHINPEIGMMLQLTTPENNQVLVRVTDMNDEMVVLDANHPLAGKELTFEIEVVECIA